jgi:hypothetical protein
MPGSVSRVALETFQPLSGLLERGIPVPLMPAAAVLANTVAISATVATLTARMVKT